MNNWDEAAADAAVASLVRTADEREIFEIFCRFGARDFRDIGHKAIYVANGWRTLQHIGRRMPNHLLRSLAYALLYHEGDNPAKRDAAPDRPGDEIWDWPRRFAANGSRASPARKPSPKCWRSCAKPPTKRHAIRLSANSIEASPQSVWDAFFLGAGELLMRQPGIVSLHAVTSTNALHYAYQNSADDETRKLLLLTAAFLTLFAAMGGRKRRQD